MPAQNNKTMGFILITALTFNSSPGTPQTVSIYHKLASDPDVQGSYTLDSNNVQVQANGFLFTPFVIPNLVDGVLYTVKAINNCGGNGFAANFQAGVTTAAITTLPATTQPVTTQPVTTAPVTTPPVTTPPQTTPVTTQPVTTLPVTTPPQTTQAPTTPPVTTQTPSTTAPGTTINQASITAGFHIPGFGGQFNLTVDGGGGSLTPSPIIADATTNQFASGTIQSGAFDFHVNITVDNQGTPFKLSITKNAVLFAEVPYTGDQDTSLATIAVAPGDVFIFDLLGA